MAPSLSAEEQERLATALRKGCPRAFEQLYTQLHGPIYNLTVRIVGDREAAADITQDVFLDAYRQLPSHHGKLRVEPWLYRVAVNTCYDHLRRQSRRPSQPLSELGNLPASHDEAARSQLATAVEQTIQRLNPRYRTALVLRDLHGFTNAEVARILGIKSSTAAVLLFRARGAFRQAFREVMPADTAHSGAIGVALLPPLTVPSWLEAPPPSPPVATSAMPALAEGIVAPLLGTSAATGGLLAKIGALLTTKTVVASLSISVIAGTSLAVVAITHDSPAVSLARIPATATISPSAPERVRSIAGSPGLQQRTTTRTQTSRTDQQAADRGVTRSPIASGPDGTGGRAQSEGSSSSGTRGGSSIDAQRATASDSGSGSTGDATDDVGRDGYRLSSGFDDETGTADKSRQ